MSRQAYIIAEMAGCHDGQIAKFKALINAAFSAKCQAIKTQWCSDIQKMADRRGLSDFYSYRLLNFDQALHLTAKKYPYEDFIDYICSVFLPEDVEFLSRFVDRFKIASLEAQDRELIDACLKTGLPLIISTGCMTMDEYENLREAYNNEDQISWLHAVSSYPVPVGESNLQSMFIMDGYSDQTGRVITGALAAMYWPKIIEVHIRLNNTDINNPDYGHSLTPEQLKEYANLVRIAEAERGDGYKKIQKSEEALQAHRVIRDPASKE